MTTKRVAQAIGNVPIRPQMSLGGNTLVGTFYGFPIDFFKHS